MAHLYAISDPSLNNSDCQFVAYKCDSYSNFLGGKCADCGSNGESCRPFESKLDYWDNPINQNIQTKLTNQFYINTEVYPQFCLFHYQIVVNIFILIYIKKK